MNTILIAEDEKFIRLGLKTMALRAPVPVSEVLEARDGEEALKLLEEREVDLLITDIRMPRMDGIELVEQLHTLRHKPMVLVVSGYDDFNYAVAMLRSGVQDYLLKPVERERFYEVLAKLEERYQTRCAANAGQERQYLHDLRFLMLEQDEQNKEAAELIARYEDRFLAEPYIGFCSEAETDSVPEDVLRLHAVGNTSLYLVPERHREDAAPLLGPVVGVSRSHAGLAELRVCYQEAREAWQQSYFTGSSCAYAERGGRKELAVTSSALLGMVSLAREQEVIRQLSAQADAVAAGDAAPESFARLCAEFIKGLCDTYRSLIEPDDDPVRFAQVWDFGMIDRYLEELDVWLGRFCGRIAREFTDYEKKQKIRQAVQYIQEHFTEQLNMAVVSNYVSMNYSLFSLLFKQYTGTNFVSYLQKLRVEETKRLLLETDWRVNEIGRRVGFLDEKHFLKVFKAATGFSPTEYRRSQVLLDYRKPDEKK